MLEDLLETSPACGKADAPDSEWRQKQRTLNDRVRRDGEHCPSRYI